MTGYVTLTQSSETAVCPVCGTEHETNQLLLDRRLRERFERTTCTGYALCPEHQRLFDEGYIALVAVDEQKSEKGSDGTMRPEDAHRTGEVAHVRREAWRFVFDVDPPKGGVSFCQPGVIEILRQRRGEEPQ